ncbi:transcription factor bHLH95-like [Zingiber officinale]|uniref:transcription factor bHLH95-like n=1 Tax=Zingiber officinale TaxID=94328 RepID=UPI001C4A8F7A|nr:transcription factor bHLH95-like [Zingiber officinale]
MSQAAHAVSETGGELNVDTWSHALQQWNRDYSPDADAAATGFVSISSSSAGLKRPRSGSSTSRDRQEAGKSGGGEPEHEIHIWTERERRKKMRNMFSSLHALLPHLPAKADKSTIVDEAVKHIQALQQKLEKLEKQKLEHLHSQGRPPPPPPAAAGSDQTASTAVSREAFLAEQGKSYFPTNSPSPATAAARFPSQSLQTWSSPNVVLSVSGDDAFICISAPKKPSVLSTVAAVMEKHKLDLLSASVSADFFRTMIMIHARASDAGGQLPETLMNEEIYKLAVGEMIIWLSTSPNH